MKKLAAVLALVGLMASLAACGGGVFKCDLCGEEKTGGRKTQEALGMKITVCDDCVNGVKDGLSGLLG
ncbi:MAG: hypothetical protein IJB48_00660 [Clostridia bacterium]|nr:hypothetical protein [Clostridia bacterium]MBQ3553958.1 hypothetical protein [Clostridia bacterium]